MTTNYNKKKTDQYVNLKTNGRLFPTWVLANFNRYKLPEIFLDDSDPCNDTKISGELRKYQDFLGQYLSYNSPYHDILVYHGLGSGKTRTAINIYNVLYNYSPDWNVFILLKATLKESTWVKELERWIQKDEKEFRKANIEFISYDAPNADKMFLDKIKNADSAKKTMYIIDEAHNFINNVVSNLKSQQGRRALNIYDHIIQDKKDNDGVRVVLISGSPAINTPYELALLFNLLRPNIFPKSEAEFNQMYVSTDLYPVINANMKNSFQRRIMGLVSYYVGTTPEYYAKKIVNYVDVPMSDYQQDIYEYYEEIEEKIAKKAKSSSNYKSYTRQSCNFVFPNMSQGFNGETRPRPRDFKIKEDDIETVVKGKKKEEDKEEKYYKVSEYLQKTEEFTETFDLYLGKKLDNDIKQKHTLADDINDFFELTDRKFDIDDYIKFINNGKKKSELLMALYNSSSKMTYMIFNIMNSSGPVLVYSNYVVMEGLQIFKIYLKYFGFSLFIDEEKGDNDFRYMEYHGGIDPVERRRVLDIFNRKENKHGSLSKIIMISPAGAEGISLNNVRQVHLMEPYWHEVRMVQMIGRAIRQCSHKDLPMNEREVTVYRYKSVRDPKNKTKYDSDKSTTDQYIEDMARSKEGLIQSFFDAMKEAAIDCVLNKSHNNLVSNFRCFQFDEKSLFDDHIGPAYKDDIYDDIKIDNGMNSNKSTVKRVKVIKIKAVKQLLSDDNNDETKDKYSDIENYWFNPSTLTVYDYEAQYPFGKVGTDEEGYPLKIDNDVYVINRVLPIPLLKK